MFGRELKNIYDMNNINDNYVNGISKYNLLHDILNCSKLIRTSILVITLPYM